MAVFTRPDSPFYWLYLETTKQRERTTIPVLRNGPATQQAKLRRAAEARYAVRMMEVAEQETGDQQMSGDPRQQLHKILDEICERHNPEEIAAWLAIIDWVKTQDVETNPPIPLALRQAIERAWARRDA